MSHFLVDFLVIFGMLLWVIGGSLFIHWNWNLWTSPPDTKYPVLSLVAAVMLTLFNVADVAAFLAVLTL